MRYGRLWVCGLIVVLASTGFALADRAVNETRSASPDAEVSIEIFAGSVTVTAWDESRVSVEGTIGDDVESLDVDGEGDEIEISVEVPEHSKGDLDLSAKLEIMVPRGAQIEVESATSRSRVFRATDRSRPSRATSSSTEPSATPRSKRSRATFASRAASPPERRSRSAA